MFKAQPRQKHGSCSGSGGLGTTVIYARYTTAKSQLDGLQSLFLFYHEHYATVWSNQLNILLQMLDKNPDSPTSKSETEDLLTCTFLAVF